MVRQQLRTISWLLRGQAQRGPGALTRAIGRILLRGLGRRHALDPYRPIMRPPPILFGGRRGGGSTWDGKSIGWFDEEAALVEDRMQRLTERAARLRNEAGRQRILAGQWTPLILSKDIEPEAGTVLHLVGKSLPQSLAGYTVRTHHIARAQQSAGLRPLVATRIGFPWDMGEEAPSPVEVLDGIPYHRLGDGSATDPEYQMTLSVELLAALVEDQRPAVLHAHSDFHNGLLGTVLAEMFDLPLVYEVRGFWEETWLSKSRERDTEAREYQNRRAREVEVMNRADHVVTLVETMRDRMVADGLAPEKITIVPNAVDPDLFPRRDGRETEITHRHGIPDDEPVIGYISSLVGYEGVENLVSATALLRKRGVPVHCLIVGDGDQRERLEDMATRSRAAPFIHFTGQIPHDQAPAYYRAIDIFVIPRRDERVTRLVQPLKPYEALSTGVPLVVSDLPALRSIVEHSGAGTTFQPGNPRDLANVLETLLGNPDLLRDMGVRGAAHVREHHTWERNAERYREVYERLGAL